MEEEKKERLDNWFKNEFIPKANRCQIKLLKTFTETKANRLLPVAVQLTVTPFYYYQQEIEKDRKELLAKLKEILKDDEYKRKFSDWVNNNEIEHKMGMKPLDVAKECLNDRQLLDVFNYLMGEEE